MKWISAVLFFFSTVSCLAQALPKGCVSDGVGVQDKQLIFNNDNKTSPRVFLLHNITKSIVMLSHNSAVPGGANTGWQSKLEADKWALVSTSNPNFSMQCMVYAPPHIGPQDCGLVVSACAIPSSIAPGGFWVAENATFEEIMTKLQNIGITM